MFGDLGLLDLLNGLALCCYQLSAVASYASRRILGFDNWKIENTLFMFIGSLLKTNVKFYDWWEVGINNV